MGCIIIVSSAHRMPVPLVYNLGEHALIITNDYGTPDAFELAAPSLDGEPREETIILDHDETYHLYQCLHTLLFQPECKETSD